jgi:hypothetical protein
VATRCRDGDTAVVVVGDLNDTELSVTTNPAPDHAPVMATFDHNPAARP